MLHDAQTIHRARFRTAAILRWIAAILFIIGPFAAMIIWERRTVGWAQWPVGPFYYVQPMLMLAVLWGPATLIALRTHHIARWIHPVPPRQTPCPACGYPIGDMPSCPECGCSSAGAPAPPDTSTR